MLLQDSVHIRRPPEQVWAFLENPENMKAWNPKVKAVVPVSWGSRSTGFRYRITYEMSGKTSELDATIEEYRAPDRLAIRLTGGWLPLSGFVQEVYELSRTPDGTALVQIITIHNSGIPFIFRALVWLIRKLGRPTGKPYLHQLKELVESEEPGALPPGSHRGISM